MMRLFGIFLLIAGLVMTEGTAFSYESDGYRRNRRNYDEVLVINRPPNIQGLTGLLVTNSAYTIPAGHFALAVSVMGENSDVPDYSVVQGLASITMGITDRLEIGFKAKAIAMDIGSSATQTTGLGDSEVLLKWRFRSQGENLPAMALGVGGIIPTGETSKGFGEIEETGVKFMVIAASEKRILDDSFIGVYMEAQVVLLDQIARDPAPFKEKYGVINAGLLFPISDDNRLQFMVEYNQVVNKDVVTLREGDYKALTSALRYVTKHINVTVGGQMISKEQIGYDDTIRLIGTASLNF